MSGAQYANSGRAKCNGRKPCKGTAIAKGQIRFGTWVTLQEHGSFKWRHWGCLTASVLKNVSNEVEGKIEELDGFEDLKPEDQEKIKKAFEDGQIDPSDVPPTAVPEKVENSTEGGADGENKTADTPTKKRKRVPSNKKSKSNLADENHLPPELEEDKQEIKKTKKKRKAPSKNENHQPVDCEN